jgi:hypothetical protein
MAAGELPDGEVSTRFRATVPLAAVPEDKANVSGPDWPKEALAESNAARAKIFASRDRVNGPVILVTGSIPDPKVLEPMQ